MLGINCTVAGAAKVVRLSTAGALKASETARGLCLLSMLLWHSVRQSGRNSFLKAPKCLWDETSFALGIFNVVAHGGRSWVLVAQKIVSRLVQTTSA